MARGSLYVWDLCPFEYGRSFRYMVKDGQEALKCFVINCSISLMLDDLVNKERGGV
jgi:hypothetical protein